MDPTSFPVVAQVVRDTEFKDVSIEQALSLLKTTRYGRS